MITQKRLKELLNYNPNTGIFTHLISKNNGVSVGDIAGCVHPCSSGKKYITIKIEGKLYRAHRLAWLYIYGQFPPDQIDHINGDGVDNRLCNLRPVTNRINSRNCKLRSDSTSGITGIHWCKRDKRWRVQINNQNKRVQFGNFDYLFEAVCVRKNAEKEYGYHTNHGSIRPL